MIQRNAIFTQVLALLATLILPAAANAYVVTGTIVDETSSPIHKALIIGRDSDDKVRIGLESDERGQFSSVDVQDSTLLIEISKEGYMPVYINVAGATDAYLDLGVVKLSRTVDLDEVTVTAKA